MVRALVPERYRRWLTLSELIAAQPNLHGGRAHLPLHCDQPLNDGFGVVIVTLAMHHASTILLVDEGDQGSGDPPRAWRFDLAAQRCEGYALAGDARNKCLHGVLAGDGQRTSLNLRFGLHAKRPQDPWSAHLEVDRHWGWGRIAEGMEIDPALPSAWKPAAPARVGAGKKRRRKA